MSDATTDFSYDHDEETLGFAEPAKRSGDPVGLGVRMSTAAAALGSLGLVISLFNAAFAGTWGFPALALGGLGVAALAWFRYRGTQPGIKHDGVTFSGATARGIIGWGLGILLTGFYVVLYWFDGLLASAIRIADPVSRLLRGASADKYFLYSLLYTAAVLAFGVRMFMKYRHSRYQIIRTVSVMFFQLVFAFLIPRIMQGLNQPEFYFSYFWPLSHKNLFPGEVGSLLTHHGELGAFLVGWGVVVSFVAVPVLTYFLGKRWYCSWVCGCGGLAETMGDPFRQLSDKSSRAWKIERWTIHSVLVWITSLTALLWINASRDGAVLGGFTDAFQKWYGFGIGLVFAGVIGVGFYPIMGSRVWCRFGCPQAAILGIFQRYLSRFRITTNGGQCMSCGNCSTYCEMGIDVRAYAQRQANVVRASCVGCGVCAAVCPRGVLKLENGATHGDRFPGADRPVRELGRSLGIGNRRPIGRHRPPPVDLSRPT